MTLHDIQMFRPVIRGGGIRCIQLSHDSDGFTSQHILSEHRLHSVHQTVEFVM